ncbi:unnamed protein product [Peronospora destructor]|uniref:SCP domain-containing protein n=1 Tax=Peronospora destructor TaxID=86335 RepID=A0AAV0TBQ9_9STRA|nr:unnamed protein product [Peronospora destructor]
MKVSTNLVVAAVLVALRTSADSTTESTAAFSLEPSDSDTEELSLVPSSSKEDTLSDSKTDLNAETESADTKDPTSEQSEEDSLTPLYDFSTTSCSSDSEQTTSGGSFTDEEKAIWVERHNFFRSAALPWAAGNMKRMNWDDELVKEAASAAESCAAETTTGLNVFKATSADPSLVIDEALNDWVVKPALSDIGSVVPPAEEGDPVGAGLYSSYTQVIWASTTKVGCAIAGCFGGSMVVCKYSPAGNDGKSAWYIHAAQAKLCSTGTTDVLGLCAVKGDPANELIAPIPEGKSSLEVYSTFIDDIKATILKAAKERDVPGADPLTVITSDGSVSESTKETSVFDTEASPDLTTDLTTAEEIEATSEGKDVNSKDLSTLDLSATTESLPKEGKSFDMSEELSVGSETSPTSFSEGEYPGTVKPSSKNGGDYETTKPSAELGDETEHESNELTSPAVLGLKATAMASTQSALIASNGGGTSPAAIAGMIVAGVVAIAVVAVFVSYRKNQKRQRGIMYDGGIEII